MMYEQIRLIEKKGNTQAAVLFWKLPITTAAVIQSCFHGNQEKSLPVCDTLCRV